MSYMCYLWMWYPQTYSNTEIYLFSTIPSYKLNSSLGRMTSLGEEKTLNSKPVRSKRVNSDNKSCYSISSCNSKAYVSRATVWQKSIVVSQRNMALSMREHSCSCEKELSLYPAVFVINGYLALACHWSIIIITQRVIFVLHKCNIMAEGFCFMPLGLVPIYLTPPLG